MLSACDSRTQYHKREQKQAATDSDIQVAARVPSLVSSEIAFFIIRLSCPYSFAEITCDAMVQISGINPHTINRCCTDSRWPESTKVQF
jgi:hypothetical protein